MATPNGAGKSSVIIAGIALWWVSVHPQGRVVITSAVTRQIEHQVWPSIEAHKSKFADWTWKDKYLETPTGGWIFAFTAKDGGKAEGWHKVDDTTGPLLVIVDEAKTVEEPIFRAIDRCTFNALLYVSSPGGKDGRFFEAHTKFSGSFRARRVGLKDCPHIPKERADDIIAQYGADHPFTKSTLEGEFMSPEDLEKFIFNVNAWDRCIRNPPTVLRQEHKIAFCDFGKGKAENVIAVRHGNELVAMQCWREADEMAAVGQFIVHFRRLGLSPDHIWGDSGGDVGSKIIALLRDAGWHIKGQNFGSPAWKPEIYVSWGSEAWHELALRIDKCEAKMIDDDLLRAQLTSRMHHLNKRGLLSLEEKHELAKRNIPSPDRADAVCGVFNVWPLQTVAEVKSIPSDWREQLAQMDRDEFGGGLAGMDAGDG